MSDSEAIILECEYFACQGWYQVYVNHPGVLLERWDWMPRASLRNRCYLSGPNGVQALSVPLLGGRNQKSLFKDVRIDYRQNWPVQHLRTCMSCYGRSPFFEHYVSSLESLIMQRYTYLLDLNCATLEWINKICRIEREVVWTQGFEAPKASVSDYRKRFDARRWEAPDIQYPQPFADRQGFIGGLSMLDLIFCMGNQAFSTLSAL